MCGIAGFFGFESVESPHSALEAMSGAVKHRGPDAEGYFVDRGAQLALGHLRLSIIDPSPAGAQPMHSADGRLTMIFNGEVYNFPAMRADLEARHGKIPWRGHSDTEVLIEAFARDGIQPVLDKIDGMFALALFDRHKESLTLVRDAFGEKPLYYGLWKGTLLFASELKAFPKFPGFTPEIDPQALGDYFKYSYVPGPKSIWRNNFKLPAAHMLTLRREGLADGGLPTPVSWWDSVSSALAAAQSPFSGSLVEAAGEGDRLLLASTSRRMMADVPLGAFLSGGIDSSMTVALMQAQSEAPIKTFSIGIAEAGFDESRAAAAVAKHLGTHHHEQILSSADVQQVIPFISGVYDEPFADSSQVPTFLVARMARRGLTVALSGDGGDEIFGGYNRYFAGPKVWQGMSKIPAGPRKLLGGVLGGLPSGPINTLAGILRGQLSGGVSERINKLGRLIATENEIDFHDRLLATADTPETLLNLDVTLSNLAKQRDERVVGLDFASRAMMVDTANYLPDDVLVKVDRATMAVGLETRTPYLERDLYKFAWSLPAEMRAGAGIGKRLLREMLYQRIPRELVDRPKAGFAIPIGRWLRTDLRDWAESELSDEALDKSGLLNPRAIRQRWSEHLSGRRNHETLLWNVLMFQGWHRGYAR